MKRPILVVLLFVLVAGVVWLWAHLNPGYSYDSDIPADHHHPDWMKGLPDSLRLSELSLPGSHDTCAYRWIWAGEICQCQSMDPSTQLEAGIRVWDIRLRIDVDWENLWLYHAFIKLGDQTFESVLDIAVGFLKAYPSEAILMRVRNEVDDDDETVPIQLTFRDKVLDTLHRPEYSELVYWPELEEDQSNWDNPTLARMRGKIIILVDFPHTIYRAGIPWDEKAGEAIRHFCIQDHWQMANNEELGHKWHDHVRPHLDAANNLSEGNRATKYINLTSAAKGEGEVGGFPYFFASGHFPQFTDSHRLATPFVRYTNDPNRTPGDYMLDTAAVPPEIDTAVSLHYKDANEFPGVDCVPVPPLPPTDPRKDPGKACIVLFEGINTLTMNYVNAWGTVHHRTGIVYLNFPGYGAIDSVINLNPWNWPPDVNVGGPYAVMEGQTIEFSAAGSTDRDGDALQYRWDFDGDGVWDTRYDSDGDGVLDTDWSSSPYASNEFMDNIAGYAIVEVKDVFESSAKGMAELTVTNVNPTATPISFLQPNPAFILPVVHTLTFSAKSSDSGSDDATYPWDFGDGAVVSKTYYHNGYSADPYPSLDGNPVASADSVTHAYGTPGDYTATLTVTDDDDGMATRTYSLHVADAAEALDITGAYIQALGSEALKGPVSQRKGTFANQFNALHLMLAEGNYNDMILMLKESVRQGMDGSLGGSSKDDWIIDPIAQRALCQNIDDIVAYIVYLSTH